MTRARLAERQMTLEVGASARRFIAEQGFDSIYGARPLRRLIARDVETRDRPGAADRRHARMGAVIRVDYAAGELTVSYENQA